MMYESCRGIERVEGGELEKLSNIAQIAQIVASPAIVLRSTLFF